MTGIHATIGWVWQDPPASKDDAAIDFWLVKAANGDGTTNPEGFDFAANYARWAEARGENRLGAWTWLYATTDGTKAAEALHGAAPHAVAYVIDVEGDDKAGPVHGQIVHDFTIRIRELAPHTPVGFTSYPTKAQATAHGAPWDELVADCDFGMPQVYFQAQGQQWETIRADHQGKPVLATFSPGDWPECWPLAAHVLALYGGIGLWRFPDTASWTPQLAQLRGEQPAPPTPTHQPTATDWSPTVHNIDLRHADQTLVTGPGVKPLQVLLVNAGFHVDTDGKGGPLTRAAVEAFQSHAHLPVDGIAGQATFSALLNR